MWLKYHMDRRVSTLWSNCYSKLLIIKDEIQALETQGRLPWGLLHRVNPVLEIRTR